MTLYCGTKHQGAWYSTKPIHNAQAELTAKAAPKFGMDFAAIGAAAADGP